MRCIIGSMAAIGVLTTVMVVVSLEGSGRFGVAAAHSRKAHPPHPAAAEAPKLERDADSRVQDSTRTSPAVRRAYKHSWLDVDGVKAHYIEAGEGAPFVLVHGAHPWSSGEANYAEVIGPLAKNFHAIAVDIVGFGQTAPRGDQEYSGEAQAKFLVRFIDALDVGPVFLTGNSHGGFLTQYVAHERPDLVSKLVITNSLSGTSGESRFRSTSGPRVPLQSQTVEQIREMLEEYYVHKELVTEERVKLIHDNYQRNYEYFEKKSQAVSRATKGDYNKNLYYKGKHISEWGGDLKIPVLLMWSEPGSEVQWGLSHFFRVPGAEMHILPWSGHHLFTDQSARWVQVVTDWLLNDPPRPPN